jgi:hypothetical protein
MKISKEEILKCIKKLKNNKACGEDLVINEYIKSTTNTFIDIYAGLIKEYLWGLHLVFRLTF